jgi:uncharacterized membrane protein
MYSKIKLLGHPIHPMLVAFPIAFYTATLVTYLIYLVGGDVFWFRVGVAANIAGVVMAAVAAIPGFLDWALGIPGDTPAKATGLRHMLLNVTALVLFLVAAILTGGQATAAQPDATLPFILALVGVVCTLGAGFFGWMLIQTHHVGVEMTPEEQARATAPAAPRPNIAP